MRCVTSAHKKEYDTGILPQNQRNCHCYPTETHQGIFVTIPLVDLTRTVVVLVLVLIRRDGDDDKRGGEGECDCEFTSTPRTPF